MVLSCDGVSLLFSDLPLSQILEFAEDILDSRFEKNAPNHLLSKKKPDHTLF